jgi:hypothetical protein
MMARVAYTSGVESFRGRIGGTTFSINASGPFARSRTQTSFKQTINRTNGLPILNNFYQLWSSIEEVYRTAWVEFAAAHTWLDGFGVQKRFSGQTLFVSMNYYRQLLGKPLYEEPPTYIAPVNLGTVLYQFVSDTIRITFQSGFPVSPNHVIISLSPPVPPSTIYYENKIRFICILHPGESSIVNVTSQWSAYFGFTMPDPLDGERFKFNSGMLASPLNEDCPVTGAGCVWWLSKP